MPTDSVIQYGSFGLVVFTVVFLLVWFVKFGFPQMLATVIDCVSRVLMKIDQIESDCRQERRELLEVFRAERDEDRKSRHEQAQMLQRAIAEVESRYLKKPGGGRDA